MRARISPAWRASTASGLMIENVLSVNPDLADHHDGGGPRVVVEQAQGVRMVRADDRVAADADAGGLADAEGRELGHRLVGEGPGTAHHPHRPALVDVAGHDPDLALLPRRDHPGAVRAYEPGLAVLQERG